MIEAIGDKMWVLFKIFFTLGCISFGGPAAHIGYFRATFVEKLAWLTDKQYADIVALSQFLPGPGSSQVGFAIGYHKGGLIGAILAFLGFTLPSILLMLVLVMSAGQLSGNALFQAMTHGLKLLAVVVLDAVLLMYKNFCQDNKRIMLCLLSACVLLILPGVIAQISVLVFAAMLGMFYLKPAVAMKVSNSAYSMTYLPLILFVLCLFIIPLFSAYSPLQSLFSEFFQAGSLVFGGGHVVLPLLQNIVSAQVSYNDFLTGYAIAQAVPGPMFTFATYIGYLMLPSAPIAGALVATLAIFLPGFLLLLSCLKHWQRLSQIPRLSAAISGVNAAVVGLLLSALYQPVFVSAVFNGLDMALVLLGFYLLKQCKLPIVALVAAFMVVAGLRSLLGY